MSSIREVWLAIRETVYTVAQVVTLGVVALVLGITAMAMVLSKPGSPNAAPARRPLAELVPTIVAAPTFVGQRDASGEPAPLGSPVALYQPPGFAPREPSTVATIETQPISTLPVAAAPPATPQLPAATQPVPTATPRLPTATARPAAPTPSPKPAGSAPTAVARATATTNPTGQMMKVLPTSDGLPARVRSEPSVNATILVRVPLGSEVEVVGTAQGDAIEPGNRNWFKIKFRGVIGFVYSPLLGD